MFSKGRQGCLSIGVATWGVVDVRVHGKSAKKGGAEMKSALPSLDSK